ncbi:DUF4386 family protein [Nonomuraea sp. B10E15]|uniref:DUF4386 family protein n=1 Tax=Nonomuraea sp. B10E15 TaxID=3153560 RepID=UPI00325DE0A2
MTPDRRIAGWSGVLAGAGLAVEAALWTASGWSPATFADPAAALEFLRAEGGVLRLAMLSGFVNLVFLVVFVAGLAARLKDGTPTLASATLWFGMIGIITHVLVPLNHWYGVPAFLAAATREPEAAQTAWTAYAVVGHDAPSGAGSLFLGLSMVTAGWAAIAGRALPASLGWLGLVTGCATVLTVFAPDTVLSGVAGAVAMPSLLLAVVFRVWGGIALIRTPAL